MKLAANEAGFASKVKIYSADISTADIQEITEAGSPWVATAATNPAVVAYDPASNSWSTLAPLPEVRQGATINYVGGKLVITQGAIFTDGPLSTTWAFTVPASAAPAASDVGELLAGGDPLLA